MARNIDPNMQAALIKGRQSANPADRGSAYQEVGKLMGSDIPYIWTDRTVWSIGAQPRRNLQQSHHAGRRQGLRHDHRGRLAHPDLAEHLTGVALPGLTGRGGHAMIGG